jgi:hypothetical protein
MYRAARTDARPPQMSRIDSTYLVKEKLKPGFHFLTASAIGRTGE